MGKRFGIGMLLCAATAAALLSGCGTGEVEDAGAVVEEMRAAMEENCAQNVPFTFLNIKYDTQSRSFDIEVGFHQGDPASLGGYLEALDLDCAELVSDSKRNMNSLTTYTYTCDGVGVQVCWSYDEEMGTLIDYTVGRESPAVYELDGQEELMDLPQELFK